MSPQAFQLAAKQFYVNVPANLIGHLPRRTALGPTGTPSISIMMKIMEH